VVTLTLTRGQAWRISARPKQIGHDRLAAAILVGRGRGAGPIAATTGLGIDQQLPTNRCGPRRKPGEDVGLRFAFHFHVAVCPPRGQAGRAIVCCGLQRLPDRTREGWTGAVRQNRRLPYGAKMTGRCRLLCHQPNAAISTRHRRNRASAWPYLPVSRACGQTRIVIRQAFPRNHDQSGVFDRGEARHQSIGRKMSDFPGRANHREQRRNTRPDPAA